MTLVPFASAEELVKTCRIGAEQGKKIDVLRDSFYYDNYVYYLRVKGKKRQFIFNHKDDSRGSTVRISCVGKKFRALVITGEFTANALQGIVLVFNSKVAKVERIDFAEKVPPEWLYLSEQSTLVVIPTNGYGETNKKYVIYRHEAGNKEYAQVDAIDELPATAGFEVIRLDDSKGSLYYK
jgi:hypothetical protein